MSLKKINKNDIEVIDIKNHISWELSESFDKLITPIKKKYHFNFVSYAAFHEKGVNILYNNRECVHRTMSEFNIVSSAWNYPKGRHHWVNYIPSQVLQDIENHYDINTSTGLTIINEFNGVIEIFNIAHSKKINNSDNEYYYDNNLTFSISQQIRQTTSEIMELVKQHPIPHNDQLKKDLEFFKKNQEIIKQNRLPHSLKVIGNKGTITLTHKEIICLYYIIHLYTNVQIANHMGISTKTVEYYIQNIRSKLAIKDRKEIFTIARNNFLLDIIY